MQTLLKRRVVVLGGYGQFSRRVATDVAALPLAECVLGLPPSSRATAFAAKIGVPFMVLDPNDPASLHRLLDGAFAAVNVQGPFQGREHLAVAARCAAHGVHYIDPAESRGYMTEFLKLAREAREHDALLVTGAGAAPAVTGALAGMLTDKFDRVGEIHVFMAPGMNDERELATTRAVLERVGEPLRIKQNGRRRDEHWWQRPQAIELPAPLGRRRGYLVDLPDLDLLAKHFSARTVTARTGFAPGMISCLLAMLAFLRRRGWVEGLSPPIALVLRMAAGGARTNASAAAVRVAMRGTRRGAEEEHVACLVARGGTGPAIAAAPITALLRQWLDRGVHDAGAVACIGLLDFDALRRELADRDIVLVRE